MVSKATRPTRGERAGKGGRGAAKSATVNARETRQLKRVSTRGKNGRTGDSKGTTRAGRSVRSSGRGSNAGWQRGAEVVGRLLEVYWTPKKEWLEGKVDQYNKRSGKHHITYKSGDEHWIDLGERRLRWVVEGGGETHTGEDDENEHESQQEEDDEVSGSAGGSDAKPDGVSEDDHSEAEFEDDLQQNLAEPETRMPLLEQGINSSNPGRTAEHEHDASLAASPSTHDGHEYGGVENESGKRICAGNGKPIASTSRHDVDQSDRNRDAPNTRLLPSEVRKRSPPTRVPAVSSSTRGKLEAALSPKGHLDFSETEAEGLRSAPTPGDDEHKDQSVGPCKSGQERASNPSSKVNTPGSSPRPRQAKKVSPGSARRAVSSQNVPKSSRAALNSCQNGSREEEAALPSSPRTRTAAGANPAQQDMPMSSSLPTTAQSEDAFQTNNAPHERSRHEAARAEANAAWERAQEMADKAVRLVKLAQEGSAGEQANNGVSVADRKTMNKASSSDKDLTNMNGRKHLSSTRRKQQPSSSAVRQGSSSGPDAAVRARVSVFWPGDQVYYKGRIIDYSKDKGMYCIRYDDNEEEWLNLSEEYFKWLGPRTRSAGYTSTLATAIMKLGPENITPPSVATLAERTREADVNGPRGEAAVGYRLGLLWEGDGCFHYGEVLAYNDQKHKHHILFDDGEDEWVQLTKEVKVWRHKGRGASLPAGLAQGEDAPRGRSAIGWRIGVYWKEDTVFYEGEIKGYDSATGKHHILYDDTEDEYISLSTEKVKWMVPPSLSTEKKSGPGRRHRSTYGRPGKKMSLNAIQGGAPGTCGTYGPSSSGKQASQAVGSKCATNGHKEGGAIAGVATVSTEPALREGAISRQARRSAVCETSSKNDRDRVSDYMCVSIAGPLRREGGTNEEGGEPGTLGDDVCGVDSQRGPLYCRLVIVERMLARVVAAHEALKLGLPAGAQSCRGSARTNMPPPPAGLRKIKTASVCHVHEIAPSAPSTIEANVPSASSPNCPTPTAFQLDLPISPFEEVASPSGLIGPSPSKNGKENGEAGTSQRHGMMGVSPSPLKPVHTPAAAGRGAKVRPGVASSSMAEAPPSKARRLDMEAPYISSMMERPGQVVEQEPTSTPTGLGAPLIDSGRGGAAGA